MSKMSRIIEELIYSIVESNSTLPESLIKTQIEQIYSRLPAYNKGSLTESLSPEKYPTPF